MKLPVLFATIIVGTSLVGLSACKSSKEVASEVASRDVRSFQTALDQIPGQIDKTMSSLNQLTAGGSGDRTKLLSDFSSNLATLKSQGMQVAGARDEAEKDVQRYFREWVKESRGIKTDTDRQSAYKAIDAGKARTDTAMEYLRNGSRDFRSLIDKLTGFQSTLSKDLSPASLKSVGDQFGVTNDTAIKVKGYIARLSEQIDKSLTGA